mgnify:CR=1 FL=1|jgi:hypothetical protein
MKGNEDYKIKFNGEIYTVNKKIHDFRTSLFMEHFGLKYEEVVFPSSNSFWATAWNVTQINTQIYDKVFKIYPTDSCRSWAEVKNQADRKTDWPLFEQVKDNIKGHAVLYPYKFLLDENLLDAKKVELSLYLLPMKALY